MLGDSNLKIELKFIKDYAKDKGGFDGIKTEIKNELHLEKNTFTTWSGLAKFLNLFNKSFERKKEDNNDDKYFSSISNRYIFALMELDGKARAKLLGITKEHYSNLQLAKGWKRSIAKQIHPDICNHSDAQSAMSKLNSIYEGMIKYGE